MIKMNFSEEAVKTAIDRIAAKTMIMDLTWDWPCGVGFYGVTRAYDATGRQEYIDRLVQWVDEYIVLGLPIYTVNTCAMGHSLLTLYNETGDERYKSILMEKVDYLENKALRFGDNVLQHTVSAKNDFPEQCWADTLFMAAYLLLRTGVKFGDSTLINDALNQFYWHIVYLQDKSNGLWYHGYSHVEQSHLSGFYWARANAWAAYTMSRVQKVLPQPYLYPQFMDIDCSLREQLATVKQLQMEDGLWHTILDDPESYGEMSASAGIGAAMITAGNPLHTKYAQKALDGLLENISEDGRVLNVSGGTAVMKNREGYRNVPRTWAQGWGQGLALAFLSAVLINDGAGEQIYVDEEEAK